MASFIGLPMFVFFFVMKMFVDPFIQVPVATILNDLSPVPAAPAKDCKSKKLRFLMSPMTPVGISSNSPDVKAMR